MGMNFSVSCCLRLKLTNVELLQKVYRISSKKKKKKIDCVCFFSFWISGLLYEMLEIILPLLHYYVPVYDCGKANNPS